MNNEFVTNAIEKDRYLKAMRLVDQFESEIQREVKNTCKSIIEDNEDLFPDEFSIETSSWDIKASTTLQASVPLDRVESHDKDSDTLKLCVSIEWTEPEDRREEASTDSALCVAHYKVLPFIKDDFERIKDQTKNSDDWNIRFGDDVHDSDRELCYIPITNAAEMDAALSEFYRHFSTYGDEYGVPK